MGRIIEVEVYAVATIYVEEDYLENYSPGDFLDHAENSLDGWELAKVVYKGEAVE